jgi:hypothetical protein
MDFWLSRVASGLMDVMIMYGLLDGTSIHGPLDVMECWTTESYDHAWNAGCHVHVYGLPDVMS